MKKYGTSDAKNMVWRGRGVPTWVKVVIKLGNLMQI